MRLIRLNNLSPQAKMGLRAALAMGLTLWVCYLFNIPRNYWSALTVMLVIAPALGESMQRAYYRLGMTVAGCAVGTILYYILPDILWLHIMIALLTLFLTMYYLTSSYSQSIFWISIFVVFIFGTLLSWDVVTFGERVLTVLIGCVIAILVSTFFLPDLSQDRIDQAIPGFLKDIQAIFQKFLPMSFSEHFAGATYLQQLNAIATQNAACRLSLSHAHYETFFNRKRRRELTQALRHLDILIGYLTSLCAAAYQFHNQPTHPTFNRLWQQNYQFLLERFDQTLAIINQEEVGTLPPALATDEQRCTLLNDLSVEPTTAHCDRLMAMTACLYYFNCIDQELTEIMNIYRGIQA